MEVNWLWFILELLFSHAGVCLWNTLCTMLFILSCLFAEVINMFVLLTHVRNTFVFIHLLCVQIYLLPSACFYMYSHVFTCIHRLLESACLSSPWTVTLTCVKLWSDLLCRVSQQYYCSAVTQAKHDNLVSQTDLTAKVPLRTLKHVNSQAISTLARQKNALLSGIYAPLIKQPRRRKETPSAPLNMLARCCCDRPLCTHFHFHASLHHLRMEALFRWKNMICIVGIRTTYCNTR